MQAIETRPEIGSLQYGANLLANGECSFRVWAPNTREITLRMVKGRDYAMQRDSDGNFLLTAPARAGDCYFYIVDTEKPVPDPVSRLLPEGVHGPTEIVDPQFHWSDHNWRGIELRDAILYELHVGTFTKHGTFDGVIEKLDYLRQLGVTMIELMPVAAFPGERNWGYDGVSAYSVHAGYGGPHGLKRLVDAAHAAGIGVMLDVVYNHLGNEGNYLRMFGPYFTSHHKTPWGEAINYDAEGSEGVRRYFIENALYWTREYHLDGLRLDAVQTIYDDSPKHILAEIQERVQHLARELGRNVLVIAESDQNDPILVRAPREHGYGLDAVWSDDFHHAMHALLTNERSGYYQDFGQPAQIVRALEKGFVFQGEVFNFWKKPRGKSADDVPLPRHVICLQNHDQVGNRAQGERLSKLASRGALKAAAALMLLAPETPLLFMGEEYGETSPFQFFTSFGDPKIIEAVRRGRKEEFRDFGWDEVPDPQSPATFENSKLRWELASENNSMLRWYLELIALRKQYVLNSERTCSAKLIGEKAILLQVPSANPQLAIFANFDDAKQTWSPEKDWTLELENNEDACAVRIYVRAKN